MTSSAPETVINFTAYGAIAELFDCESPEVIVCGPAGTGKTRGCLEYLHWRLATTPMMKALMARKTLQSLKTSAIKTYEEKVNPFLDGVVFKNETRREAAHYLYPNGARLYIGGLDKPQKIMSTEYDLIYIPECTETLDKDWDAASTRVRNGKLHYQQLLGDCNPDGPTHWARQAMDAKRIHEIVSIYEDNPLLWDQEKNDWTAFGKDYIARLDNLRGVRYLRLRLGFWAAAEGMVYQDSWDRSKNIIDRFPIPPEWPRYLVIDFGYTNPFVCLWFAVDPDGRLYCYRQLYKTHLLVEDAAREILAAMGYKVENDRLKRIRDNADPLPYKVICDHDAEDRKTLERHTKLYTSPAHKSVSDGIQAVAARLRPSGDDRPRLFFLRDSLIERDPELVEQRKPTCFEEEIESYVWRTGNGIAPKEEPVKEDDHGQDACRYMVADQDCVESDVTYGPKLF
jgi:PBSX family phage terminase large subunit